MLIMNIIGAAFSQYDEYIFIGTIISKNIINVVYIVILMYVYLLNSISELSFHKIQTQTIKK